MAREWLLKAKCRRGGVSPENWFPGHIPVGKQPKRLCSGCPVIQQCATAWLEDKNKKAASVGCIIAGVYIPETGKMAKQMAELKKVSESPPPEFFTHSPDNYWEDLPEHTVHALAAAKAFIAQAYEYSYLKVLNDHPISGISVDNLEDDLEGALANLLAEERFLRAMRNV